MPVVHLLLIICHLALSIMIPYLLYSNFIQPLVLWVLTAVTVLMESVYLVPGIVIEVVGLCRRRPLDSAWLQAGLHLTIMILAILPHTLTVALLLTAKQIPSCPSVLFYTAPTVANFESHLRWSGCASLPKVAVIGMANVAVLLLEVFVTGGTVGLDYWMQGREVEERIKRGEIPPGGEVDAKRSKKRRWMTGMGRLLWEMEGILLHRTKAKHHGGQD